MTMCRRMMVMEKIKDFEGEPAVGRKEEADITPTAATQDAESPATEGAESGEAAPAAVDAGDIVMEG
jgi:hypothetical protein